MEKRAILAAVLMAALLIIYQTFFLPVPPPPDPPPPKEAAREPARDQAPAPAPPAPAPPIVAPSPSPSPARTAERPPQRTVPVETPLYRAVVSSEGGKLQEWELKYRGQKPMVIVGELGPQGLVVAPNTTAPPAPVPMTLSQDGVQLGPDKPTDALVLTGEVDGLRLRQTLRFQAATFAYETQIRLENSSATPRTVTVMLPWSTRTDWQGAAEKFLGQHPTEAIVLANGASEHLDTLTVIEDRELAGSAIAMGSVWYLAAIIPKTGDFKLTTHAVKGSPAKAGEPAPATRVAVGARATPTIAPGQAWEGSVLVYVGPKEYDRLAEYGLETTINFGGFPLPRRYGGLPMEWLGVPILRLMNWINRHVGNYGVAIILLTVVSKILFYPLTVKSMRSMKAMQALQPQINALRSKHKGDARRLQQETMDLYRKHKVNPAGGCLPMVAQIPIFYALYLALSVSVELQGATFMCVGRIFGIDLWICDLASHDPTYVLPVLMGVTMFVQQKMTPIAGDPRQAKMMLMMPFIFTFMFLNLPAGLVLYWTVSNVLQILQQWFMDRPVARRGTREAKEPGRA